MQQIGVGINEKIVIAKAFINENKWLILELNHAEKAGPVPNVFDTLLTAGVQNEGGGFQVKIFPPLLPSKVDQTIEKKMELVGMDLTKLKNVLTQILEQFLPMGSIDLHSADVTFAKTGIIDGQTFNARILDQDILDKIFDNLVKRFIELITPFINNPKYSVRFKLIRQSKDKHFATIPKSFILEHPFIELMDIPVEQSKVKFTKYEIENGLNDATPIKPEEKVADNAAPVMEANPFASQ